MKREVVAKVTVSFSKRSRKLVLSQYDLNISGFNEDIQRWQKKFLQKFLFSIRYKKIILDVEIYLTMADFPVNISLSIDYSIETLISTTIKVHNTTQVQVFGTGHCVCIQTGNCIHILLA